MIIRLCSFFCAALLSTVAWAMTFTAAFAAPVSTAEVTELVVLYDQNAPTHTTRAEDIVASLNNAATQTQSATNRADVRLRFGEAQAARLAITERLDSTRRAKLADDAPEERLQRYVVLTYPTRQALLAALAVLKKDPHVISVNENLRVMPSVVPNDPLYAIPSVPTDFNYQWGMKYLGTSKGLESAWDTVRGTASIAILDVGVYKTHPELSSQIREHFSTDWVFKGAGTTYPFPETIEETGDFRGHGTHVAGIAGAKPNNSTGVSGICWDCNLWIQKVLTFGPTANYNDIVFTANGLNGAAKRGAQVVNMSFGTEGANCTTAAVLCDQIVVAQAADVVMVAASGNIGATAGFQYPASDSRVIAAGAIQSNLLRWSEAIPTPQFSFYGSNYKTAVTNSDAFFVAPGANVLSTFEPNKDWAAYARCTRNAALGNLYGPCTGTSMATPHVAGLVALLRSAFPLLTTTDTIAILKANSWQPNTNLISTSPTPQYGWGVPNIQNALVAAERTVGNRLTPLFSFFGSGTQNYFYTVFPQQARAAINGDLVPVSAASNKNYTTVGNAVTEYPAFPSIATSATSTPRAQLWVFSTQKNPLGSTSLVPLYRFSYRCPDAPAQIACGANPNHVDHAYITSESEKTTFINQGYKYDGIEGYLLPTSSSQPPNTVKVYRVLNSTRGDYAVVPESALGTMSAEGYGSPVWLGYAYANSGARPKYSNFAWLSVILGN
jgi:serine protease